jgi:3-isopropylmalate dehydratase small subunit
LGIIWNLGIGIWKFLNDRFTIHSTIITGKQGIEMEVIRGRVWKVGDQVNTDLITPGQYLTAPLEEVKKHVLEAINPRFAQEARGGDILVAGKNFGCGSSRESAPSALKAQGISAVVAESFARIFFRNAVAIGLAVVPCPGISSLLKSGRCWNWTSKAHR